MISCSPGPGLSRVRRGTGVHGGCDRSSRSARGPLPPRLLRARPSWRVRGGRAPGLGVVRTPARPRPPAFLPRGAGGTGVLGRGGHSRRPFPKAPGPWRAALPSSAGRAGPTPRCSPPGLGALERVAPGPPWCPWSAPGRLRCLRPSGGVVSFPGDSPRAAAAVVGVSEERVVEEVGKGGAPVPLAGARAPRLPFPSPLLPPSPRRRGVGGVGRCDSEDLAGLVSARGGPGQRRGAWPARGAAPLSRHGSCPRLRPSLSPASREAGSSLLWAVT